MKTTLLIAITALFAQACTVAQVADENTIDSQGEELNSTTIDTSRVKLAVPQHNSESNKRRWALKHSKP